MPYNATTPASLEQLAAAVEHGRAAGATEVADMPLELLANLLALQAAAEEATQLLEDGKARAARRVLTKALNHLPPRL